LLMDVMLLLQSNSEEIEQLSFVQHYKRKVLKSKATIQPFATRRSWLTTASRKRPEVNEPGN
jgi:hypothetical protein